MRAEDFQQQRLELAGWAVQVSSYHISELYLAEVEVMSTGTVVARSTGEMRDVAEEQAVETALRRLSRTRLVDFERIVGG